MKVGRFLPDIIVWVLFALVTGFTIAYHDMWRDEWQAILLSYKSQSLHALWSNTRDEGHPLLWYMLLYIGKYLGPPTVIPKLINYMLVLGYGAIVLRYAPFKPVIRYMLLFGYFFVFEYAAISRNYAVSILLIVAVMAMWQQRYRYVWAFSLLLLLLTQTTIYGSMMVLSFILVLITTPIIQQRKWTVNVKDIAFILSGGIGVIVCYACASRVSFDTGINIVYSTDHLIYTLSTLYDSYLPLPEFSHNCWNSILPNGYVNRGLLALPVIAGMAILLIKNKPALVFWFSYITAQLAFTYIYFIGYSRQMGYLYISGIVALWFVYMDKQVVSPLKNYQKAVVILVLLMQVCAGGYFVYDTLSLPFTESHDVAEYLKTNNLAKYPVYGSYHYCMTGISGYLDKPVVHLDDMKPYTFMPWEKLKRSREQQSDSFLQLRIPAILSKSDTSVILLTYPSPLMDSLVQSAHNAHIQLLQTFNNSNEMYENFNVYLLKR